MKQPIKDGKFSPKVRNINPKRDTKTRKQYVPFPSWEIARSNPLGMQWITSKTK